MAYHKDKVISYDLYVDKFVEELNADPKLSVFTFCKRYGLTYQTMCNNLWKHGIHAKKLRKEIMEGMAKETCKDLFADDEPTDKIESYAPYAEMFVEEIRKKPWLSMAEFCTLHHLKYVGMRKYLYRHRLTSRDLRKRIAKERLTETNKDMEKKPQETHADAPKVHSAIITPTAQPKVVRDVRIEYPTGAVVHLPVATYHDILSLVTHKDVAM